MADCKKETQVSGQPLNIVKNNSSTPSDDNKTVAAACKRMTRRHSLAPTMGLIHRTSFSSSVTAMAIAKPESKKKASHEKAGSVVQKPKACSPKDKEEYGIVMLGAGGVGKTALVVRFVTGRFLNEYDPTLERTYVKEVEVGENSVSLQILDTANNAEASYIRRGEGFIVVYSITDHYSFEVARQLVKLITEVRKSEVSEIQVPILLVGNKRDLRRGRKVSKEEGRETASEFSCSHFETSAADNRNVHMIFYSLVFQIRFMKQSRQSSGSTSHTQNGFLSSMKRHLFRRQSLPA